AECKLVRRAREAHLARGVDQHGAREHPLELRAEFAVAGEPIDVFDDAALEVHLVGADRLEAEERVLVARLQPRPALVDDEGADAIPTVTWLLALELREHQVLVDLPAADDERLAPGERPAAADALGHRREALDR